VLFTAARRYTLVGLEPRTGSAQVTRTYQSLILHGLLR